MNYITDYQLDINKGFMCKVNGIKFTCAFLSSDVLGKHFYVSNILKVADAIGIARQEFIGIFNSEHINHVIYCDSKQQCYDLCQHIVDTYFKPDPFTKNDEEFTVEIYGKKHTFFLTKNGMFYWDSKTIDASHFNDHISLMEVGNICYILKINKHKHHNNKIGFETKEDAVKFAKYIIKYHYPRNNNKSWLERSRRYLSKYYNADQSAVVINSKKWNLIWDHTRNVWWYHNNELGVSKYWEWFGFNPKSVIDLCSHLEISAKYTNKLEFDSRTDAIKFTDYLLETYIINKKEKTYDTNRLRKERTSLSRGAKPAGSIIHGRRSKASVRCGRIEHKACLGS